MGLWFRLDALYRAFNYWRRRDPEEIRYLCRHLPKGGFGIDVGGYKGGYTWWMRRCVGEGGRVVTFEPQPHLHARITRMIREFGWANVTCEQMGLSDTTGELRMSRPTDPRLAGQASFERQMGAGWEQFTVPVATLDGYLAERGLKGVNFIKMDAEAHEFEIFLGAEQTLLRDRPVLLFECLEVLRPGGPRQVFDWLRERGYRGWFFWKRELVPVEQFDPAVHQRLDERHKGDDFVFEPVPEGVKA